jgi:hypothetical protein
MAKHNIGPKNGMWKGGRTIASNGYVLIRVGKDHHLADCRGYAYEHRLVAEKMLGRRLRKGEQVHHGKEGIQCNKEFNLSVAGSFAKHRELEGRRNFSRRVKGQPNPLVECACGCGCKFSRFDSSGRPRSYVSGHNMGKENG